MRGIALNRSLPGQLEEKDFESFPIKENQVRIRIKAAALNHRDEWCRQGLYPNLSDGIILGSDGAGVISELGSKVKHLGVGQEVIVNPGLNWGDNQQAQAKDFQIIGTPNHGTLAEELIINSDRVYPKPSHLNWEQAAALPLAGLTAYRALVYQGQVKSGEKILITGFGGGVAQIATLFALALEAEVYVSSSSSSKIDKAISLGVKAGFNYRDSDWTEKANSMVGGFDLMIDGAAGDTLNDLIKVAVPGGRIVFYGATLGNPSRLEARKVFWNQLKIMGSTMGSDRDFEEMLDLVNREKIKPIVDQVFSFGQAIQAFERMKAGDQMGKIVLKP